MLVLFYIHKEVIKMVVQYEVFGFEALSYRVWGASKAVCKEIIEQGRQEEAMAIIEREFSNSIPNEIELNDFIGERLEYYMELWDKE